MSNIYPGSPYQFYKQICLDENGLLCGLQELLDSLNNMANLVGQNTLTIQDIQIGLNDLNEEVVEINSNIEELGNLITNIDTNCSVTINNNCTDTCVIEPIEVLPNLTICNITSNPTKPSVVCSLPNKSCKVIIKTIQTPTCIKSCDSILTIQNINGFNVVTSNKWVKPLHKKTTFEPKVIERIDLPQLKIPYGWVYSDGSTSCVTPEKYYDSKGRLINVPYSKVGFVNKSVCYKK